MSGRHKQSALVHRRRRGIGQAGPKLPNTLHIRLSLRNDKNLASSRPHTREFYLWNRSGRNLSERNSLLCGRIYKLTTERLRITALNNNGLLMAAVYFPCLHSEIWPGVKLTVNIAPILAVIWALMPDVMSSDCSEFWFLHDIPHRSTIRSNDSLLSSLYDSWSNIRR